MTDAGYTVELYDGKYTIKAPPEGAPLTFLRYGEPWPGGQERFQFAGLVLAMFQRIQELERPAAALEKAREALLSASVELDRAAQDQEPSTAYAEEATRCLEALAALAPEEK